MYLTNPCKKCVVQAMCNKECEPYEDFKSFMTNIEFTIQMVILIAYICIMILPPSIYLTILENRGVDTDTYGLLYVLYIPAVLWGGVKLMVWLEWYLAKTRMKRER